MRQETLQIPSFKALGSVKPLPHNMQPMDEKQEKLRKIQEGFQFIMQGASVSSKLSKVEFRKSKFNHFSTIDNSHFKTESSTKIK